MSPSAGHAPLIRPLSTSPAKRRELGRLARTVCPLPVHADLVVSSLRPDPVTLLGTRDGDRAPALVELRRQRMSSSPFAFFRGAALVMAHDLACTPTTGITVQLAGDAHLANFGVFGLPGRRPVPDLRDFDETHPGPWEWDVKRLAASLVVAGRENGFSRSERAAAVLGSVRRYRRAMLRFAEMSHLEVWFAAADGDEPDGRTRAGEPANLARVLHRIPAHDAGQVLRDLTERVDGRLRLAADPSLVVPARDLRPDLSPRDLRDRVRGLLGGYASTLTSERRYLLEQFWFLDVGRCATGTGDAGNRCWLVLLAGRDSDEPLVLQVRQAAASVLSGLVPHRRWDHEGQRVVSGQRLLQGTDDPFLGWYRAAVRGRASGDFYVRRLLDSTPAAGPGRLGPSAMAAHGELCGATLARAHARSGDRFAIAGYLGEDAQFEEAVAVFAEAYADRNARDHQRFVEAHEARPGRAEPHGKGAPPGEPTRSASAS